MLGGGSGILVNWNASFSNAAFFNYGIMFGSAPPIAGLLLSHPLATPRHV